MQLERLGPSCCAVFGRNVTVLFSYERVVAVYVHSEQRYYRTIRVWSNTTSRHISRWLDGKPFAWVTQERIEDLAAE